MSDISGAFDKVFSNFLLVKLRQLGVGEVILNFFAEYLKPRRAHVVVSGVKSEEFVIENMVYQGTVLGPLLWNTFLLMLQFRRP